MNIVIIGATTYDGLECHLQHACEQLGHGCEIIDYFAGRPIPTRYIRYATQASEWFDLSLSQRVLKHIHRSRPDLVICTYRDIHPRLIADLKTHNFRVIHFNPDTLTTLQRQQIIASPYDCYFTKCPIMEVLLKKIGKTVFSYRERFNPTLHQSQFNTKQEAEQHINIDVMMIGEFNPYRVHFLRALEQLPYSIRCFGYRGRYYPSSLDKYFTNQYITGHQKADLIYGSKVVVNNFHFGEINSVNNKFFEIGGIGGVQVTDYKPVLSEFYDQDTIALVSFCTLNELVEKVDRLLTSDAQRFQLSALNKAVFAPYTYTNLIQEILNCVSGL